MNLKSQIELIGLLLLIIPISIYFFKPLPSPIESEKEKKRSLVIDFVRGLAMMGIVIIHIDSYFEFYHKEDPFINFTKLIANFSRFCVPVFIITSGTLLSWKTPSKYWKGKLIGLLVPFLIFSILGYFTKYKISENLLGDLSYKIVWGKVFAPYYYVPLLFQFYILFSLAPAFFDKLVNSGIGKILLILTAFINIFSNQIFPANTETLQNLENISFTNFIFFFFLGIYLRKLFLNGSLFLQYHSKKIIFVFSILFVGFLIYISYVSLTHKYNFINHFLFYPTISFIILFYLGVNIENTNPEGKIFKSISYIGKKSLSVFLLHPIVIHIMHIVDPFSLGGPY
ncbi:MAG: acyltransferase, partial [Leptospiraceae bacterium]|nr:acyltransferase [Leptospiraceae bacterium]